MMTFVRLLIHGGDAPASAAVLHDVDDYHHRGDRRGCNGRRQRDAGTTTNEVEVAAGRHGRMELCRDGVAVDAVQLGHRELQHGGHGKQAAGFDEADSDAM